MPPKGSKKLDAKRAARLRKRELEEQKRRRARRERLRTWLLAGLGVLVGGMIVAAVVVQQAVKQPPFAQRAAKSFGVSLSDAACTSVESPKTGTDREIGPGSKNPEITKGSYDQAPPVGGDHATTALGVTQHFYGPATKPSIEKLVKSELDSTTVVWYLPSASKDTRNALQDLARWEPLQGNNAFLVVPWWPAKPTFPAGKTVAIATKGHVQYCAKASGEAVQRFVDRYGPVQPVNSPPPNTIPPSGVTPTPPAGSPTGTTKPSGTSTPTGTTAPSGTSTPSGTAKP